MQVHICSPLRSYTGGRSTVEAHGGDARELIDDLERQFAGIRFRMVNEQGNLRPHLRLFVNSLQVSDLETKLHAHDEVHFIASLSGG